MRLPIVFLALYLLGSLTGCVSYEELRNFQEVPVTANKTEQIDNKVELQIQPKDLLRIDVESVNPEAAMPFNQTTQMASASQASSQNIQLFQGYLVDEDGYIDLPLLGRIEAAGQTLESLQFLIRGRLREYLRDPVVNVRFLNFKVTILGEVFAPGVITMPNSRVTILEALGMAGDLTDYANRDNILVVREEAGVRSYQRISLQDDSIFNSEYYYLKQNDVIYVDPIRARTATVSDPGQRLINYLGPVISIATSVILTLVIKN
ncbi:polysaccharide export outer membrane protein [Neolewinella xylanilytica]|uniref:Polysaccharide export outer membrane protein n=1 Tax=Neolewinella xylanilytica TaxID=1514080 RepID=A0A2S6I7Q3_9BACT|nr:polysaccharide biosynthesis/export family protein [Neolewinella xylanilytica]PPK87534.1 polysaccharide export outer membrane protein [Neolewinella xylanilytica]